MLLKINVFKIPKEYVDDLTVDLEENGYYPETDHDSDDCYYALYLRKKRSESQGWLDFYKGILDEEVFSTYAENLGSDTVSGVFLIERSEYAYAVAHGQAHYIVRKYCDTDFGLDLAERILDPEGLKMKHSKTFSAIGKKDITSYPQKRKLEDSREYGEAFSYLKCKTIDKAVWGETIDCGESVRFSFGKGFNVRPEELHVLTSRINQVLNTDPILKLPRYHKVTDQTIKDHLNRELSQHFMEFLTDVDVEDYWLTGVSFNFTGDYHYSLRFKGHDLTEVMDTLDVNTIREIVATNASLIKNRYDLITVVFYDEDNEYQFNKRLQALMQVTIEYNGKYYVLYHNEWVQFSESYVSFIKEQVDGIQFELKGHGDLSETELIDTMVATGQYTQLHKDNVYIGKYCIEKADLMDQNNVIMIKDQHQQADLVYLIKQATTSLRLSDAGELGENVFVGHNVCLWMLVERKTLDKLSDFKSFHLLDALNDFKREVTSKNLTPVVWVSLSPN